VKLLIALHGNPGTGADLAGLLAPLRSDGLRLELPTRPEGGAGLDALVEELDRLVDEHDPEAYALLGYSWGAWLALTHAARAARPPAGVALVNPYLVVEDELSPVAGAVLRVPLLGRSLLKKVAGKAPGFVEKVFRPDAPPPELAERMERALASPALWGGAARYKLLQQRHPLPALRAAPGQLLVLRGAADAVGAWETQRRPLAGILGQPSVTERAYDGAGHALPWTHAEAVRGQLSSWIDELAGPR
jgi:pimeloyl-ACP methyl ester carboxylesterase